MISFVMSFIFFLNPSASALETFAKRKIRLAGQTIEVEIADTGPKQEQGLMYRTSLAEKNGMLFQFGWPDTLIFWMKNTEIPLSIGYFDQNRKLINTVEMAVEKAGTPEGKLKRYPSLAPALYALEMNKGWFPRHHIKKGAIFTFVDQH